MNPDIIVNYLKPRFKDIVILYDNNFYGRYTGLCINKDWVNLIEYINDRFGLQDIDDMIDIINKLFDYYNISLEKASTHNETFLTDWNITCQHDNI